MLYLNRTTLSVILVGLLVSACQGDELRFARDFDIIYHKERGFALTMDRVAPLERGNQAAIAIVVSGGWFSNHEALNPREKSRLPDFLKENANELLQRGYTLFYVVHGTQPKFTIREIHDQISESIRFIRHHASTYRISPNRIGVMGGSAGGHLSLMQGTHGLDGKDNATQPRDASSRVQAVVAYFPPTDFVNYGAVGVHFDQVVREVIPDGKNPFLPAFDYYDFDSSENRLYKVADAKRLAEHYRYIAPRYHVTEDDAPTLLLHGDADKLVPLQQSELMVEEFRARNVPHRLYVKNGGDHGWPATIEEARMIADWFDQYLTR